MYFILDREFDWLSTKIRHSKSGLDDVQIFFFLSFFRPRKRTDMRNLELKNLSFLKN